MRKSCFSTETFSQERSSYTLPSRTMEARNIVSQYTGGIALSEVKVCSMEKVSMYSYGNNGNKQ